jgi:hypothetical protein
MNNDKVSTRASQAEEQLRQMESLVALTSDGKVALMKSVNSAEQFIVACLVAQHLAHGIGKAQKQGLSIDEIISAGGLAQRTARQTVYNTMSKLSKARIVQKSGGEFFVDERVILQFFATVLPDLISKK